MKVMVTFNVETDLDIVNSARGEIIKIVLDERETALSASAPIVQLAYQPAYILMKMNGVIKYNWRAPTKVSYHCFH